MAGLGWAGLGGSWGGCRVVPPAMAINNTALPLNSLLERNTFGRAVGTMFFQPPAAFPDFPLLRRPNGGKAFSWTLPSAKQQENLVESSAGWAGLGWAGPGWAGWASRFDEFQHLEPWKPRSDECFSLLEPWKPRSD